MIKEISLEQVGQMAKDNHIWVDSVSIITQRDEMARRIGEQVLSMLADTDRLLEKGYG